MPKEIYNRIKSYKTAAFILILHIFLIQNIYSQTTASWSTEFDHLNYGQIREVAETASGDLYLARNNHRYNVSAPASVLLYDHITGQITDQNSLNFSLYTITGMKLVGDSVLFISGSLSDSWPYNHRVYKKNVNSSNWQQICQTNKYIYSIEVYNNKLFIGGDFTSINGNNFYSLATYDINTSVLDSVPQKLSDPMTNAPVVYCLKNNGTDLIVGGRFMAAGSDTLNSIALYNTTGWHQLNKGLRYNQSNAYSPGLVLSIAIDPTNPSDFVAGGSFNYFGNYKHFPTDADVIAKWKQSANTWDTIPRFKAARNYQYFNGPNNLCDLRYYNNELYISYIYPLPNPSSKRIIKINNSSWSLLPIPFKDERAGNCYLHQYQGDMIISSFNCFPMHGALRYNSNGTFKSFGLGMGYLFNMPSVFTQDNNNVYISNGGGSLNTNNPHALGGGASASMDMMKLDLNTMKYDSIRSHFYGSIYSLTVKGDSIIVLGNMTSNTYLPSVQLNYGAIYNKVTKTWSRLINSSFTQDPNSTYFKTIAFYGNGFFIGGKFKINNNDNLQHLVYWNGSSFDSLKFMPHNNTFINSLAITNDTLWVGGQFKLYNNVQNFAAYKISTKQWVNSTSITDYSSNMVEVKKVSVYKNKVFVAGKYFFRYIPFGGSAVALPDTNGSAGYYDRNNLNNYHPFTRFKKNSYPDFINLQIRNDSIVYLLGSNKYKGSSCNTGVANCDSSGGIVKYNYLTNKFYGYLEGGVDVIWGGVSLMADYSNQTYLFGSFLNLANGIHSKNIAANNWDPGMITSVDESDKIKDKSEILLYPNPTNGIFTIKSENPIKQIEIFDFTGKLIHQTNNKHIDIKTSPSGIYLVKVKDIDNKTYTGKV